MGKCIGNDKLDEQMSREKLFHSPHSSLVHEWVSTIFHQVPNVDREEVRKGVNLLILLRSLVNNPSAYYTSYVNIHRENVRGVFETGNCHFQLSEVCDNNDVVSFFQLIIADNSEDKEKNDCINC